MAQSAVISGQEKSERPTWHRYFTFNTDHKVIGIQYMVTATAFLFLGITLAMIIRAELFSPGAKVVGAETYNGIVTTHGTTMIFLWLIPVYVGLSNYIMPIMIGAPDMAFPRLNEISYYFYLIGGWTIVSGLAFGPAEAGWTSYAPLSIQGPIGQTLWLIGLILTGASSIMTAVNFLTTTVTMRAPGMTMWRMPLFVWAVFATATLMLFGTSVLTVGLFLQLFDRLLRTAFFEVGRGGDPLLWQHIFWFYSHPAVYIMILPGFGMISEVFATFSRKALYGYKVMVISVMAIAVIGFFVWAHHMFTTGVAPVILFPMMIMSMIIAVPTGIKMFNWLATLWGGKISFRTPLLFGLAFMLQFLIGGITGVFQASIPLDLQVEDSYFIVGHLHYTLFGGGVFAGFAGIYYWYPKITGRMYNETLGRVHVLLVFLAFQSTYLPMFWLGLNGMPRRVATYPVQFAGTNEFISIAGFLLGFSFLVYIANMIGSWIWGPKASSNPWRAYTLEWATASPPPEHNFEETPTVTTGPYPYGEGVPVPEFHADTANR